LITIAPQGGYSEFQRVRGGIRAYFAIGTRLARGERRCHRGLALELARSVTDKPLVCDRDKVSEPDQSANNRSIEERALIPQNSIGKLCAGFRAAWSFVRKMKATPSRINGGKFRSSPRCRASSRQPAHAFPGQAVAARMTVLWAEMEVARKVVSRTQRAPASESMVFDDTAAPSWPSWRHGHIGQCSEPKSRGFACPAIRFTPKVR
jgi:hypothetical protein